MRSVLVALLGMLAANVVGQRTHLVLGPDLQTAIDAAAPGDVLLVRGTFSATALLINKPLHIHAQPGGASASMLFMEIANIPAGGTLVLQGFAIAPSWPLSIRDCAGKVLLAGLSVTPPAVINSASPVVVTNCVDIAFDQCRLNSGMISRSSTTHISRSTLIGVSGPRVQATPALAVEGGRAILTDSTCNGAPETSLPAASGILLVDADVRLSGAGNRVHAGSSGSLPIHAVAGTGNLAYDSRSTFLPFGGAMAVDPRLSR